MSKQSKKRNKQSHRLRTSVFDIINEDTGEVSVVLKPRLSFDVRDQLGDVMPHTATFPDAHTPKSAIKRAFPCTCWHCERRA